MTGLSAAGGDPVCWMNRVCPGCGLFLEEPDAPCPRCGAILQHEDDTADESGAGPLP